MPDGKTCQMTSFSAKYRQNVSPKRFDMEISDQDRRILAALQADAGQSLADLARTTGMATSTVWRRVQEAERAGLIRGRVAILDPVKAGAGLCVFATVRLADHSEEAIAGFARIVRSQPQILEAHATSGTADYILKIRVRDVADYEAFLTRHLLRAAEVKSVVSSFSLKSLKETTALPL